MPTVQESPFTSSHDVTAAAPSQLAGTTTLLQVQANPFLADADPTDELAVRLGHSSAPADTFEGVIDQLLEADPNAAGFMRRPLRAVFLALDQARWAAAAEACPNLQLHEYRAIRFYSENYYREINGCLRTGFRCLGGRSEVDILRECNWRFLRLLWWIHQGVLKLSSMQAQPSLAYRWHKLARWKHWLVGEIFESPAFMSATGPKPNVEIVRYGDHFGHLLLVMDLAEAPKGCVADISMCSKFEEEGETLLLPWLRFEVTVVRALDEDEQQTWQAVQAVHLKCLGSRFCGSMSPDTRSRSGSWKGALLGRCAIG
mmetsp:Transcript_31396/g.80460  ORF Transcript_31396/g.80460 Transcript_31396/m.80460 type:complete len:315 (-) Transcript_31396:86-1030(-)|eukprot:jgi/Tetstr1/442574/TSEL_030671.t1